MFQHCIDKQTGLTGELNTVEPPCSGSVHHKNKVRLSPTQCRYNENILCRGTSSAQWGEGHTIKGKFINTRPLALLHHCVWPVTIILFSLPPKIIITSVRHVTCYMHGLLKSLAHRWHTMIFFLIKNVNHFNFLLLKNCISNKIILVDWYRTCFKENPYVYLCFYP